MRYAAHAGAGCFSGELQGNGCARGAASAVVAKIVTNQVDGWSEDIYKGIAATVAGGVTTAIGGGKFANGALTAAYGFMFNYCAHNGCFKRAFSFGDAVDHWKQGQGRTVTDVDVSELNMKGAFWTQNPNDPATWTVSLNPREATSSWIVYGSVTARVSSDGIFKLYSDTYDFDLKPTEGIGFRNVATVLGAIVHGGGAKYDINFVGSGKAPDWVTERTNAKRK